MSDSSKVCEIWRVWNICRKEKKVESDVKSAWQEEYTVRCWGLYVHLYLNGVIIVVYMQGLVLPFVALTVTTKGHKQPEKTSQICWPPKGSRKMLCDMDEDEPFFASNLLYYPELPQPQRVGPYQTYRNWRVISKQQQQQQKQQKQQRKQQSEAQVSQDSWRGSHPYICT